MLQSQAAPFIVRGYSITIDVDAPWQWPSPLAYVVLYLPAAPLPPPELVERAVVTVTQFRSVSIIGAYTSVSMVRAAMRSVTTVGTGP